MIGAKEAVYLNDHNIPSDNELQNGGFDADGQGFPEATGPDGYAPGESSAAAYGGNVPVGGAFDSGGDTTGNTPVGPNENSTDASGEAVGADWDAPGAGNSDGAAYANDAAYDNAYDPYYDESGDDYDEADDEPLPEGEYTNVPRPKRKKKRPLAIRLLLLAGKLVLALVLIVAILAGGLIGYLTVTEYTPAHAENAQRGAVSVQQKLSGHSLRLLTLNTGYGGLGEEADFFMDGGSGVNPDDEKTVTYNMMGIECILEDADADIILLQEVDTDSSRSFGRNQWLQYEYDLKNYESRYALNYSCDYVPYPVTSPIGRMHSGLATYSRYDISSATRYSLPCPFTWPTRIANLKRCLLVTRIPIANSEQELVVINLHLEAYDDGEGKAAQTEQLLSLMREEYAKGNYVIAGGDFNQAFPGTTSRYPISEDSEWKPGLLDTLSGGWEYTYDDSAPTCRSLDAAYSDRSQLFVIDGYIVSPNVQVDRVKTLDEGFVYTDHNPVLLEVTLLQ